MLANRLSLPGALALPIAGLRDRSLDALARRAFGLERKAAGLRERQISVDGVRWSYLEGGRGPALVLLHGIGANKDHFVRTARSLTRRYRLVVPDLPGFGDSERLPIEAGYTIDEQCARLQRFAGQVAPGALHIGGNSMGAWISLRYAALYSEQVLSVWPMSAAGVESADKSEMLRAYEEFGEYRLFARNLEEYERTYRFVVAKPLPLLPRFVRDSVGRVAIDDYALHTQIFDSIYRSERLESFASEIRAPVLLVWGQDDRVLDVSGAPLLLKMLPKAELELLDGVGHLPMLEAPKRVARDYLRFRKRYR